VTLALDLDGADVLWPDGLQAGCVSIFDGPFVNECVGRRVDLSGYRLFPGMVDVHGDAFERHVAPRRGAMKDARAGLLAAEAEIAANGITTGVLARFVSWEGGLRSPDFADYVLSALADLREEAVTDLRAQVRLETHLTEVFEGLPDQLAAWGVTYLVFNDHLPHERLATGRRPPRLNGQALKAGMSPEKLLALMHELHARDVSGPVLDLATRLCAQGVRIGSHDDATVEDRDLWRVRGADVSEFPETLEAAEAARAAGDLVVMGAPNVVRGGSHNGNISAIDLVAMGLCDALASDYHYPSLLRAALFVARVDLLALPKAWALVSEGPARVLGLSDRGRIAPGLRADLIVLDARDQVVATISGGRVSFMRGDVATRFIT
jgi:alpha-D-ribose 1-methylphosphonate 5-triphosphate diphosphatase